MITAVLLDLDNTLFNFDKAEAIALKRMLEHFGIEASDEVAGIYHGINDKYWKMLEKGKVTRGELRVKRFDELFEQLGIELLGCEATPIYEGFLGSGHYYMEHAEELIKLLLPKYDLYLASNGTSKTQWGRIRSAGLEKIFKGIYISEDMGINKPAKEYFEYILKDNNLAKEEVVMIGDSLSSDMLGGINAGIRTIWYNPKGKTSDLLIDYRVSDLLEIPSLLEKM